MSTFFSKNSWDSSRIHFYCVYQNPLSFSSRINILNNILKNKNQKDTKLIKKLNDIANIRNIFAHSDLVIKNKDNEEYVFNPKDFSKPIDFEKEYTNFYKLTMVVDPVLFKLYTDMGGKLEKKPSFVFLDENSTKVEGEKE